MTPSTNQRYDYTAFFKNHSTLVTYTVDGCVFSKNPSMAIKEAVAQHSHSYSYRGTFLRLVLEEKTASGNIISHYHSALKVVVGGGKDVVKPSMKIGLASLDGLHRAFLAKELPVKPYPCPDKDSTNSEEKDNEK